MTTSPTKNRSNTGISRREALLGLGGGFTLLGGCAATQRAPDIDAVFTSGVASGDPTATSMVIWTRAYNPDVAAIPVGFEVSEDAGFSRIVRRGTGLATTARDYTLKVDIESLAPGNRYFYRFRAGQATARTGPLSFRFRSNDSWGHPIARAGFLPGARTSVHPGRTGGAHQSGALHGCVWRDARGTARFPNCGR